MLERLIDDLNLVRRAVRGSLWHSATIVIVVGLAIGTNLAMFAVGDRLLFRPLPFDRPDELVQLHLMAARPDVPDGAAFMPEEVAESLRDAPLLGGRVAWEGGWLDSTVPSPGENPLQLAPVTANSLEVLGVRPVIGRDFNKDDERDPGEFQVLLAHETWVGRWGASPDVLSMKWSAGRRVFRVIGVLPRGFFFPSSFMVEHKDGLVVLKADVARGLSSVIAPVARLPAGQTTESIAASLDGAVRHNQWRSGFVRELFTKNRAITVMPIRSGMSMLVAPYLRISLYAVWFVLGTGCVNVATLILIRSRTRRRETAVSLALGASAARLAWIEWLRISLLCLAGGAFGWFVFAWAQGGISGSLPPSLRGFVAQATDARIFILGGVISALCGVVAILPTLLETSSVSIIGSLRHGPGAVTQRSRVGVGMALVVVQCVFSAAVSTAALAAIPGVLAFALRPSGFEPNNLFVVGVSPRSEAPAQSTRGSEQAKVVSDVVQTIPYVDGLAFSSRSPLVDYGESGEFWDRRGLSGLQLAVGPNVFRLLQVKQVAGREFGQQDTAVAAKSVVVDQAAARALWPSEPTPAVVGKTVMTPGGAYPVIGVVADIRSRPGIEARPAIYFPAATSEGVAPTGFVALIRMKPDRVLDARLLTQRLNGAGYNVIRISSANAQVAPFVERPRFLAKLFAVLMFIAVSLAGVGVYSLTLSDVMTRQREMAIRLALGAVPARLRMRVIMRWLLPIGLATALGLAVGVSLLRNLSGYGVGPVSTLGLVCSVTALMLMLGGAAIWRPTTRATKQDPVVCLKTD